MTEVRSKRVNASMHFDVLLTCCSIHCTDLLMEHLVARLAQTDPSVQMRQTITDTFVKALWEVNLFFIRSHRSSFLYLKHTPTFLLPQDLPHPVGSLISDEFRFRQPDGSNNNLYNPKLGASGQPYARTVPPLRPKMPNLPEPEVVFDALLKREKFVPHPSGISSMLFANAVIVVREWLFLYFHFTHILRYLQNTVLIVDHLLLFRLPV